MSQFNARRSERFHGACQIKMGVTMTMECVERVETAERTAPVFLIVVPEPLVAADISEAIRERALDARVLEAASMDEATGLLSGSGTLELAFVAASGTDFEASPLAAEVAARGGDVVLMGHSAEKQPGKWRVLRFPFGINDLADLLARFERNLQRG